MGRAGHISKAGTRVLSVLSMRVTIPCMLFSRVVPQVSWELLLEAWPMALLPLFFVATGVDPSRLRLELYLQSSEPSRNRTGLALGSAVVKITRPPDSFRKLVVAAIAFGSS